MEKQDKITRYRQLNQTARKGANRLCRVVADGNVSD